MSAKRTLVFKHDGEAFSGYNAATDWLGENGYSYGAMQVHAPTGFVVGDAWISKWRNLSSKDRAAMDGRIEPGDFFGGDVTVTIK